MKQAYIYIRVSTEEQANKGFSQRSQGERLLKYCIQNNIDVLDQTFEDYSAKTFNRPTWCKLIAKLKQYRKDKILLLFTTWDRFSRNAADAYSMIRELNKLGVEPQAIDQPLNLAIPENKIMLALYLATSEVENDRRSLNVIQGMRRAKKEGRWLGQAPMGYLKTHDQNGRKYIEPKEPEASLIKNAFEEIAKNISSTNYNYHQAVIAGLRCSQSNFWRLLKNPVYCGRIQIEAFEKEKAYTVKGLHEKLITVSLFEKVQKVLESNKKMKNLRNHSNEWFPLRGFLICPRCKKTLTGSRSQGNTKLYSYYHCNGGCRFRVSADDINNRFTESLKYFGSKHSHNVLYNSILKDIYSVTLDKQTINHKRVSKCIEKLVDRQINAHELFLTGKIDYEDYLTIKESCDINLKQYCNELQQLGISFGRLKIDHLNLPLQAHTLYEKSDIPTKRQLITLLFGDRIVLDIGASSNNFFDAYFKKSIEISSSGYEKTLDEPRIISFFKRLAYIELNQKG
jgi:site-specific DNA recombinase